MTTLIFPATGQAAEDYAEAAAQRGEKVLRVAMPTIYEPEFMDYLKYTIEECGVTAIYPSVASVYHFLAKKVGEGQLPPDVRIIGKSPIQQQLDEHAALMKRAEAAFHIALEHTYGAAFSLRLTDIAGALKQAAHIYGESNEEKLAAMMGIFCGAPIGDVVEIGSLAGRTAFVLLYLAWKNRVGPVLTVDPWAALEGIQHDSPEILADMTNAWDHNALAEIFHINLTPARCENDHVHLRLPSREAFWAYTVHGKMPKSVRFTTKVSVIHIDGNHDYAAVKEDCDLWLTRMQPGGWLILDDYEWIHGDGPRRVGDELLRDCDGGIRRSFVCGKALFVQFMGPL